MFVLFVCGGMVFVLMAANVHADIKGALYMYNLSDFTGPLPYNWVMLSVDKKWDEVYVAYQNEVDIFNEKGMRVYKFGNEEGMNGVIYDLAVAGSGDIFVLLIEGDQYRVTRCNYRGEPLEDIEFMNLPEGLSSFMPTRIFLRDGRIYLSDLLESKMVVVTDTEGLFLESYDINALLALDEMEASPGREKDIVGFSIDGEGNMLFTMPTLFKAFRLSPDRKVEAFGQAGSIPGKFGVVAGISSDEKGNIYIVDTLKCVVIVFNKDLQFVTEFGFRGDKPENLIAPKNLVVNDGMIYVSQSRKRGVSVYKIVRN